MIIKKIKKIIRPYVYASISMLAKITSGKLEEKVIFTTTQGSYTCNPKAICEELIESNSKYKLVWAVFKRNIETEELRKQYPKEVKIVKKGSYQFYKEFYTSKFIIDNEHNFGRRWHCFKRKGQIIIQTWHGSLGLKRIAVDNSKQAHKIIKKNLRYQNKVDYVISNSDFETNVYRTSYWQNNEIKEFGHPRNDILFLDKKDKKIVKLNDKIRKVFNIPKNNKIFLYAPTFREQNLLSIQEDIDYDKIKETLSKKFGGNWSIIVRFHERERKAHPNYCEENNVIDGTLYPDMQELLSIVDIGVTDYSSWICDFVLTGRPGFIYGKDINSYKTGERGFYYPLSETPFPVAKTVNQLIKNIENFDLEKYKNKTEKFLQLRGCIEDGNATKRVVELINKK